MRSPARHPSAQQPSQEGLWAAGPEAVPGPRRPRGLALPALAMPWAQLKPPGNGGGMKSLRRFFSSKGTSFLFFSRNKRSDEKQSSSTRLVIHLSAKLLQ